MLTIDKIVKHAEKIASGQHETVRPGMPFRLNEAASIGDAVRQGDLYLEVVAAVPKGHKRVSKPKASDLQLMLGSTQGARHCLDSFDGVQLYHPADWPAETLIGPCFLLTEDRTVVHPTHGHVTIAAGHTILCSFQREYDAEAKAERRNAD